MENFQPGDRISWQYTHSLNGRSSIERIKKGVFLRIVKSSRNSHLCVVKFDDNHGQTRVPTDSIKHE